MRRDVALARPLEHHAVKIRQRMTQIHHQHQSDQTLTSSQIGIQMLLPVRLQLQRYLGVAVTGQIHQATFVIQPEKVDQLRTPRRLGRACQTRVGQGIEGAGLTRIGAAGKSHFQPQIGRALGHQAGAFDEGSLLTEGDERGAGGHGIPIEAGATGRTLMTFTFAVRLVYNAAVLGSTDQLPRLVSGSKEACRSGCGPGCGISAIAPGPVRR